jgi:chromosome partitioning protein
MTIITVANQKGGVGKTTTAVTLAHGLALQRNRVLLLDLDPQGQAAVALGLEAVAGVRDWLARDQALRAVIVPTGRDRLSLLPGDKSTGACVNYLLAEHRGAVPFDLLLEALRPALYNGLDYVVVDTSPSVGELQAAAIYAADLVLIPARCDYLSQDSVQKSLDTVELVGRYRSERIDYALLPTFFDERNNISHASLATYRAALPHCTLEPIHVATRLADAAAAGKTIFELEPGGRPATEYARLVWYVRDTYG